MEKGFSLRKTHITSRPLPQSVNDSPFHAKADMRGVCIIFFTDKGYSMDGFKYSMDRMSII